MIGFARQHLGFVIWFVAALFRAATYRIWHSLMALVPSRLTERQQASRRAAQERVAAGKGRPGIADVGAAPRHVERQPGTRHGGVSPSWLKPASYR